MSRITLSTFVSALVVFLSPPAVAQAPFPELEPDSSKFQATPVACMTAGDFLTGATTGAVVGLGAAGIGTADYFRIQTCVLPLGIYEHTLTLASATPGQTASIRGLAQAGVVGLGGKPVLGTDVEAQGLIGGTNKWYGFGRGEFLYVRVEGTPATPAPYTHTLATMPVLPIPIGSFEPGVITISSVGMGHITDTDFWVYNASFDALPGFGNDDTPPIPVFQSTLTRFYAPGVYYLAVSAFNLANEQPAPLDDASVAANVLDFPHAALTDGGAGGLPVDFSVTDVLGVTPVVAALGAPGEVLWFRFQVGVPMVQNCFPGVAGVVPCPCGQPANPAGGCANFGATATTGAVLDASGLPSLAADSLILTTSNHRTAPAAGILNVFFTSTGTTLPAGIANGAGVRCYNQVLKRIYVGSTFFGTLSKPGMGDPSVSARTAALSSPISAGQTRHYFNLYRDIGATAPAACNNTANNVNVTNAGSVTWGP